MLERQAPPAPSGMRGWLSTLSPRDRAIYLAMLAMLTLIVAIYLVAGLRSLLGASDGDLATQPTHIPASLHPATPTNPSGIGLATSVPSAVPPTPTDLPTSIPPTQLPTETATAPLILPATSMATVVTSLPNPSSTPASPTSAPTTAPTNTPSVTISSERLTLYFGDVTGSMYVPVQRRVQVENQQRASAAVRELIAGPRNGLQRLVPADTMLIELTISDGTATVNFNRRPSAPEDNRGLYAIVLTLTEFQPSVIRVQFQVNGQNIGIGDSAALYRPTINPLNPQNLPIDFRQSEFLPLYFPSVDGIHDIRVIRLVPKTKDTAAATIRALIEGPGAYANAVRQVIPAGTTLRGITLRDGVITLDLTQPFVTAQDRAAAVRTIVQSLTTLRTVTSVQFLVEGRSLAEQWGDDYGKRFGRAEINAES